MWTKLSHNIIKYRAFLISLLGAITIVMGFFAREAEMSYNFSKTVPQNDPDMINFMELKTLFGEDGNLVAIGIQDSSIFSLEKFNRYSDLATDIRELYGVKDVISLPGVLKMTKREDETKFSFEKVFTQNPETQEVLDSLLSVAYEQKFFTDQIINKENGAIRLLISIEKGVNNSAERITLTEEIIELGQAFEADTGIDIKYAGLPFVRSVIAGRVADEMKVFLILSILVTGLILLFVFRSWDAVVFPLIIIGIVVIWVMGTLVLFDYKITILTGLIPPLIVVIGIPNAVYLLNKYHQEFEQNQNKLKAISKVVRKIGMVTLITNFTTAIGFAALITTDIVILREFGIVASINILATFVVSIILIPGVFSWLPSPSTKKLLHLTFRPLDKMLTIMDIIVHRHRPWIYGVTIVIVVVSVIGMYKIDAVSHIVDDLPNDSQIKKDMKFFEDNFSGIMPLEIIVDTGKKRGVTDLKNLRTIDEFETFLASQKDISQPVSVVTFVKAARQAFYNGNPDRYALPTSNRERGFLLRYLSNNDSSELYASFVDSTLQVMRVSMQVADIGSDKMDNLINNVIQPKIDSLFDENYQVKITGTTPLFIKGNKFLIENLRFSLLIAFIVISIIMGILFVNFRMIVISLIPNMIPLLITAGLMGYMGIALKPSTALIFSIAFGISVDDSIHFLAKYRQELFANDFFVSLAISKSLRETGASMLYTSIILFAGFIIFAGSDFGGTKAMGILTSITLLVAMITNLVLLPSLLMTFDDGKRKKNSHPIIEQYDSEYHIEGEDEEINLDLITLNKSDVDSRNKNKRY